VQEVGCVNLAALQTPASAMQCKVLLGQSQHLIKQKVPERIIVAHRSCTLNRVLLRHGIRSVHRLRPAVKELQELRARTLDFGFKR